jgi:GrpB-like predicted nucleotidyltransferase (UPF0157 family)
MMGDTDFPTVMANGPVGFLQEYMRGKGMYHQEGTDIPERTISNQYAQERGGPLVEEVQVAGAPGYPMTEKEINDRLFRYGLDNNPEMKKRLRELKQKYGGLRGV